jgi:hypothetical protein
MSNRTIPGQIRTGAIMSLIAVLFGFSLGGLFGLNEDAIKGRLNNSADAVLTTTYNGDVAAKDAVVSKSWDYLKRAHMHGGGIGAAALGTIAMLILMTGMGRTAQLSALALGAGAIIYSLFWLVAGFTAPGMGSTGAAKEALRILAVPGAGLALLGVVGSLVALVRDRRTD